MSRLWIFVALALSSVCSAAAQQRAAVFPTSFTIFFERHSTALSPEATVVLDTVADKVIGDRELMVLIDAYAIGAGAEQASAARGNAVRHYLITRGIAAAVITVSPNVSAADAPYGPDRAEIRLSRMS